MSNGGVDTRGYTGTLAKLEEKGVDEGDILRTTDDKVECA